MKARGVLERARLRLPVRVKLAIVSAGLTFVILLLFALVVGAFTERKLRSSFNDELRATAADFQQSFRVRRDASGKLELAVDPDLLRIAGAGGASVRVVDRENRVLGPTAPSVDLGPPYEGQRDVGDYRVVTRPLFAGSLDRTGTFGLDQNPIDGAVAFVQYGKPKQSLNATTARVRLFLAFGVIGGTMLAFLAGLTVARRAMRPIAGLTRAAREVARTRDPGTTLPKPEANDEVADLADTLEDMLRELDAARAETEAALDRQRKFVADASHELRTPLTSILANLELLEAELSRAGGPRDGQAATEITGSALRSSRRMRHLVGDLLLLARADAGRWDPRRPVDFGAIVREAATEAAPLASGHPLTVDVPEDGEPLLVEGAPDDLHRLVLNLVQNAFMHTPAGTPVVASAARAGQEVRLQVADRGPGIPSELRGRIFERFARTLGSNGERPEGSSGLGLAIVRAVTEAHGGSVDVGEAQGGGAVFTVALPALGAIRSPAAGVSDPDRQPVTQTKGADHT